MSREGQSLTFKYDHNGMRIQKVLEHSWYPETTNYTYHGKLLTHMEVAYTDFDEVEHTDKLHFFYDAQSRPMKVRFNGTIYTYVHNLQGDIVGILDSTGNLVVEYKYDAWGKLLSTTGSLSDTLGKRNPFRYRGYVYDEESGLYYLKSRFYNSYRQIFLNADAVFGEVGGLLSHGLYAYCYASPVMYSDPDGLFGNGSVHHWVCEDIVARSGNTIMNTKHTKVLFALGGYGLIDLFDAKTLEMWEVKRVSVSPASALAQFGRYLEATIASDKLNPGKYEDVKYVRGRAERIPPRAFLQNGYFIMYFSIEEGFVLYDYINLNKVTESVLFSMLAGLFKVAGEYTAAAATSKSVAAVSSGLLSGTGGYGYGAAYGDLLGFDFRVGSYNAWMSSFAFKY